MQLGDTCVPNYSGILTKFIQKTAQATKCELVSSSQILQYHTHSVGILLNTKEVVHNLLNNFPCKILIFINFFLYNHKYFESSKLPSVWITKQSKVSLFQQFWKLKHKTLCRMTLLKDNKTFDCITPSPKSIKRTLLFFIPFVFQSV